MKRASRWAVRTLNAFVVVTASMVVVALIALATSGSIRHPRSRAALTRTFEAPLSLNGDARRPRCSRTRR